MISGLPPRLTCEEQEALAARVVAARQRIEAGDQSDEARLAFTELRNALVLDVWGRMSVKKARKLLDPGETYDDVIQTSFISTLRACSQPSRIPCAWLVGAGVNGIRGYLKAERQYRRRYVDCPDFPAVELKAESELQEREGTREVHETVKQCLDALPDLHAEVMRLRFGVGVNLPLDFEEIGDRLGINSVKAYQVYNAAMTRLRLKFQHLRRIPAQKRPRRKFQETVDA